MGFSIHKNWFREYRGGYLMMIGTPYDGDCQGIEPIYFSSLKSLRKFSDELSAEITRLEQGHAAAIYGT